MRTPDSWHTAQATVAIAVVTAIAHVIVTTFGARDTVFVLGGFIPATWSLGVHMPWALFTPLSATLLHGDYFHLILNLVMLAICGRAVEGALGPLNMILLYLVGAYVAAAAQFALDPMSGIPMVGASGAISAVIGAYAMLFGKNRVKVADPRLALWLNALWLLVAWVLIQGAMGIVFSAGYGLLLGVGAHIGGFVAGLLLARPMLLWRYRHA